MKNNSFGVALPLSGTSNPQVEVHKVTNRVDGEVGVEIDDER